MSTCTYFSSSLTHPVTFRAELQLVCHNIPGTRPETQLTADLASYPWTWLFPSVKNFSLHGEPGDARPLVAT